MIENSETIDLDIPSFLNLNRPDSKITVEYGKFYSARMYTKSTTIKAMEVQPVKREEKCH